MSLPRTSCKLPSFSGPSIGAIGASLTQCNWRRRKCTKYVEPAKAYEDKNIWASLKMENTRAQTLLFLVPHETSHGIMGILENSCMLLPKALKMRTPDTQWLKWLQWCSLPIALVAQNVHRRKALRWLWYLGHPNPALLQAGNTCSTGKE